MFDVYSRVYTGSSIVDREGSNVLKSIEVYIFEFKN